MACACNSNNGTAGKVSFTVKLPDGSKSTYKSEVEAVAAAKRQNGVVIPG